MIYPIRYFEKVSTPCKVGEVLARLGANSHQTGGTRCYTRLLDQTSTL